MLQKLSFLIIGCILFSCKGGEKSQSLQIDRFPEISSIPSNSKECHISFDSLNKIPTDELHSFLISVNDFTTSLLNRDYSYYYGFKYKLSERYYLLSITRTYHTIGQYKNVLIDPHDVLLYTYDVKNKSVLSNLVITQSDPILRTFDYNDGKFRVISEAFWLHSEDTKEGELITNNVKDTSLYIIKEGRFQKK